jgi:hypothetical protein
VLIVLLAEILWIWAAARIASAAGRSRPAKKLEDKAAIDADRELAICLQGKRNLSTGLILPHKD